MKYITPQIVHYQPDHIPANLHPYQDENSGIAALLQAADDIAQGKKASFAVCHMAENSTVRVIDRIVIIKRGIIDGKYTPRICGEGDSPDGAGSHALIPSYYDYCMNPPAIASALALLFAGREFFRVR